MEGKSLLERNISPMRYLRYFGIAIVLIAIWLAVIAFGTAWGWFSPQLAPAGDFSAFATNAIGFLEEREPANAALVLLEDGQVFDEYYHSNVGLSIGNDTLFPVSSMSKWITAYGVLTLVEQIRLDLDRPVSDYLKRWELPESQFDHDGVTVRRLLQHRAGLTDGLGFGNYEAEEELPDLVSSLSQPRGSSGEPATIRVGRKPGSAYEYSGGSYLLLELVVEDITGQSFESYMQQAVFEPLNMRRSNYNFIGDLDNTAGSYTVDGEPAPLYRYASSAATALNTSPSDLIQFLKAHIPNGHPNAVLSQQSVQTMREPQSYLYGKAYRGTGVMLSSATQSGDYIFGHDGGNDPDISAAARVNPDNGDGIIILISGDPLLAFQLAEKWAQWQTGEISAMGINRAIEQVAPVALIGCLAILFAVVLFMWLRSKRARNN